MADHVREQIMAAAIAAVTNLATTGANVFRDRDTDEDPLHSNELPGLVVEDDGEPVAVVSIGVSRLLERDMRVKISAHVKATSGSGAELNQILKEIEIALATAPLGGAKKADLDEVGAREKSSAADKPCVRQTFVFVFPYYTAHDAPDVAQ